MRYRRPVLLCALLLVAATVGAVPASAQPAGEETTFEVQLQDDGDARWTIVIGTPIEDQQDLEEFRAFGERFESNEEDFPVGVEVFEQAAGEASTATGREMAIRSTDRTAAVVNDTVAGNATGYGELRVSFTWTSFARIGENGTMYVGDAFNTTDGTWLPGLERDQTLVIRSPPGYGSPTTSPIGAEGGDLRWEGPQTFEPGYFEIEYQPHSTGPVDTMMDLSTILLVGALLFSAAALIIGLYLLWRRHGDGNPIATVTEAEPDEAEPTPDPGTGSEPASIPTNGAAGDEEPDLELLSDEERVEYLLEQNGGRMKQANIVKETGWSNAKVSQLLSSMEEEGRVDKLRIGRENLISLPDEGLGEITENEG
ncbi:helix-turn-helix transcriptional regulator [Natronomonas amylolytica]|uniref:helix-turn-helix transcriptional regulator n=1 Tax=Natronomonas amylolytica TaxID=3108498 RepID=UPI003009982D